MDFDLSDDHKMIKDTFARFCDERIIPAAEAIDEAHEYPYELFRELGELGLLGITLPEEAGGAGMDTVAAVIVHHELSKSDPGFCLAYLAHAMLFVNNFYYASNEEQRARYLPKVISGEWIAGMGMTEPGAGTDVLSMTTTATKDGDSYVLNGTKTYITNGCEGFCFQVYAKVDGRISAFVVDRECAGFSTSNHIDKLGMRGSTMSELIFEDCRVPASNLLGGEGTGVTHMMRNLEIERLTLAAMSVGIAERCCEIMVRHGQERKAFGQPINRFGQIQRYIGDSWAMTEAAKCLVYNVARDVGPDVHNRIGSDAAKLFAGPVAKQVADNAMQVMGGSGYCKEYPVERLWRDAKLIEIGGGTLEAHQKNMTKDLAKRFAL